MNFALSPFPIAYSSATVAVGAKFLAYSFPKFLLGELPRTENWVAAAFTKIAQMRSKVAHKYPGFKQHLSGFKQAPIDPAIHPA